MFRLLFLLSLLELVDSVFILATVGPFTLGKWSFVILGLLHLRKLKQREYEVLLIPIGLVLASIITTDVLQQIKTSVGLLILTISSIGVAKYINRDLRSLELARLVFIFGGIWWLAYLYRLFTTSGLSLSFDVYNSKETEIINHHSYGTVLTIAAVIVFLQFCFSLKRIQGLVFLMVFIVLCVGMIVSESRSNLLIVIFISAVIYFTANSMSLKTLLSPFLVLISGFFIIANLDDDYSRIRTRYTDVDMFQQSNQTRVSIITKFFNNLSEYLIIGKGPLNPYVQIDGGDLFLTHITPFTYLITGGLISFIGVSLIYKYVISVFISMRSNWNSSDGLVIAMSMSILLSSLFYDIGGLMWYFFLSLGLAVHGKNSLF